MAALAGWYGAHSTLINLTGINILLALSLYVTLSCAMLSLANAAFMGIGAYTAALLTLDANWPFWAVLPAGALAAALVAVPLGLPILRLRGVFLAIATIGFGEVIRIVALSLQVTGGALGIPSIPAKTTWWQIALALLAVSYLLWHVERSRLGHAFAAIRQDELVAASLGINVTAHKMIAFVLGAFIAGLAGGLSAHLTHLIAPADFGFSRAVDILVYAVVGGTGAFWGAFPGAALLTLLPEWLRLLAGFQAAHHLGAFDLRQVATGLITLLVIIYFPGGISGTLIEWRRRGRAGGDLPGDDASAASTAAGATVLPSAR
jgi:branched-chain amino acid transport system permease protein